MKVAGLFAGIGGFELGLERAGHSTVLLCDIDPVARQVLRNHFDCRVEGDVRDVQIGPDVDLITAGFPCQDLSQAGKTKGLAGSDSSIVRYLFELLANRRVPSVLIENVPFMLHLNKGHAMNYLVSSLEHLGYDWAYRTIDAQAFGLPQRRKRVFLYASLVQDPRDMLLGGDRSLATPNKRVNGEACGFYWTEGNRGIGWAVNAVPPLKGGSRIGIVSAPAIVLPGSSIVLPDIRDGERLQGFRADWTKPATQLSSKLGVRWRLVGNAVNVRVSKWLGKRLNNGRRYKYAGGDDMLSQDSKWPASAWGVGGTRALSKVSSWPVSQKSASLAGFLKYPTRPLSHKATRGFMNRYIQSPLRLDDKFLADLKNHLEEAEKNLNDNQVRDFS